MMERRNFKIESLGGYVFEGFTNGQSWNGWSCPFFEKDKGLEIVEVYNSIAGNSARYDEKSDTFVFKFPGDDEDETYFAEISNGKKLYGIGSGAWIWEESG